MTKVKNTAAAAFFETMGLIFGNYIGSSNKPKISRPKYKFEREDTELHVYAANQGIRRARKIISKYGMHKAIELYPELRNANFVQVVSKKIVLDDNGKYNPERLRMLRKVRLEKHEREHGKIEIPGYHVLDIVGK